MSSLLWKILPVYKILEWVFAGIILDMGEFSFFIIGISEAIIILLSLTMQKR